MVARLCPSPLKGEVLGLPPHYHTAAVPLFAQGRGAGEHPAVPAFAALVPGYASWPVAWLGPKAVSRVGEVPHRLRQRIITHPDTPPPVE